LRAPHQRFAGRFFACLGDGILAAGLEVLLAGLVALAGLARRVFFLAGTDLRTGAFARDFVAALTGCFVAAFLVEDFFAAALTGRFTAAFLVEDFFAAALTGCLIAAFLTKDFFAAALIGRFATAFLTEDFFATALAGCFAAAFLADAVFALEAGFPAGAEAILAGFGFCFAWD
jgi:hypothetical protein